MWLRNRATAAHALGQAAEERVCLDALTIMERVALAEPEQEARR